MLQTVAAVWKSSPWIESKDVDLIPATLFLSNHPKNSQGEDGENNSLYLWQKSVDFQSFPCVNSLNPYKNFAAIFYLFL